MSLNYPIVVNYRRTKSRWAIVSSLCTDDRDVTKVLFPTLGKSKSWVLAVQRKHCQILECSANSLHGHRKVEVSLASYFYRKSHYYSQFRWRPWFVYNDRSCRIPKLSLTDFCTTSSTRRRTVLRGDWHRYALPLEEMLFGCRELPLSRLNRVETFIVSTCSKNGPDDKTENTGLLETVCGHTGNRNGRVQNIKTVSQLPCTERGRQIFMICRIPRHTVINRHKTAISLNKHL